MLTFLWHNWNVRHCVEELNLWQLHLLELGLLELELHDHRSVDHATLAQYLYAALGCGEPLRWGPLYMTSACHPPVDPTAARPDALQPGTK